MYKKITYCVILVFSLCSFIQMDTNTYSEFVSKEGIKFISYSKKWNEQKLKELNEELLKNTHGEEIHKLKKVIIYPQEEEGFTGSYNKKTKEIKLYNGNKENPIYLSQTLSHEYGHHIQHMYFPEIDGTSSSKWAKARGLQKYSILTKKQEGLHLWYAAEIFAEDYKQLYGTTKKINQKTILTNEAYDFRNAHENEFIPNVMENEEVQKLVEKRTGFKIDRKRLIKKVKSVTYSNNLLTLNVESEKNVHYFEQIDFYPQNEDYHWKRRYQGFLKGKNQKINNLIQKEAPEKNFTGMLHVEFTSLDVNTNLAVSSDFFYFDVENGKVIKILNEKEMKEKEENIS